jgi:two-component system chemotaxis sensor kinase CheA
MNTLTGTPEELELFLAEAAEQLAEIERCLIAIEEGGDAAELVKELFRNAHSLKGSAGAVGHTRMARLAHALETAMERHRTDGLPIGPADGDAYLAVVDGLRALADEVAGDPANVDVEALTARLSTAQAGATHARLTVRFDPDAPLVVVRAVQVLMRAGELAGDVRSQPTAEQIEAGEFDGHLTLEVPVAADLAALAEALYRIDGVVGAAPADETRPQSPAPATAVEKTTISEPTVEGSRARAVQTVRIDVARLDALMALVGELVIDRNRIARLAGRLEERLGGDGEVEELGAAASHLERISTELQAEVMKSRLLPVDTIFSRFPRMVRDVSKRLGKEVQLEVVGRETELDRSVIEDMADPLVHLIRNAIDHGIESPEVREAAGKPRHGTLRLSARHEESFIVVEIADDGKGIDPAAVGAAALQRGLVTEEALARMSPREVVDLIFAAGFSLAKGVTDLSGRGVGMDVVRSNVQRLKGSVSIETTPGQGTRVTVKLPLTLAIMRALLVSVAGRSFAVPLSSVVETVRIDRCELKPLNGAEVVRVRGEVLPVVPLRRALRLPGEPEGNRLYVVATRHGAQQVGLVVDGLIGEQEIVVKPIGALVGEAPGIAGATILGDGKVAPILDTSALIQDYASTRAN